MKSNRVEVLGHSLIFATFFCTLSAVAQGQYLATGIKIGEVTDTTAIVWVRLTKHRQRIGDVAPMPAVLYRNPETGELLPRSGRPDMQPVVQWPDGHTIDTIEGAVPGAQGEFRIMYKPRGGPDRHETAWMTVSAESDYAAQVRLKGLAPATTYEIVVATRGPAPEALAGSFRTAPSPETAAPVTFTVSTGQAYPDRDSTNGFKIYGEMLKLDPDFFVHTGDILYYDDLGKTVPLARWHWQRTYSMPSNLEFHRQVASYFIKDDHDTWMNDCWPGQQTRFMGDFTFEQGLAIFREQVPMSERTYRTFRWGKDLQIWLVEGRDFRSPNTMPDGPDKTIWGDEQKEWFFRTVQESGAAWRILISPTPVVGPDRTNKRDNHSDAAFTHEGNEIRRFIASQENLVVVCGDRHWQYVSVDADYGVREYSCGPASNEHAGGWSNDQRYPEHEYLNVTGGFLAITVDRVPESDSPRLTARHYSVNGAILNEDTRPARGMRSAP